MSELTRLLGEHGLLLVFVNVLLAQAGLPLPAVPTLVVAGALAYGGQLPLVPILALAVVASLLPDSAWFAAGRRYGYRILQGLCQIAIEPDSCVKQTETIFERWGTPSLVVAKFIPGFATVAPPLAGTVRVPFVTFLLYSTLGAVLWAGVSVAAGMLFHAEIDRALAFLAQMGMGAVIAIGSIVAVYVAIKALERYLLIRFLRMVRISVDELHDLLQKDAKPLVLDARSSTARRLDPRRIPGAIPVDITDPNVALSQIPPGRDVIVYCS